MEIDWFVWSDPYNRARIEKPFMTLVFLWNESKGTIRDDKDTYDPILTLILEFDDSFSLHLFKGPWENVKGVLFRRRPRRVLVGFSFPTSLFLPLLRKRRPFPTFHLALGKDVSNIYVYPYISEMSAASVTYCPGPFAFSILFTVAIYHNGELVFWLVIDLPHTMAGFKILDEVLSYTFL